MQNKNKHQAGAISDHLRKFSNANLFIVLVSGTGLFILSLILSSSGHKPEFLVTEEIITLALGIIFILSSVAQLIKSGRNIKSGHREEQSETPEKNLHRFYPALTEISGEGILLADHNLRFLECNRMTEELYGIKPENIGEYTYSDLLLRPEFFYPEILKKNLEKNLNLTFDSDHKNKEGKKFRAEVKVMKQRLMDETVFIFMIKDISEFSELTRTINLREKYYRAISVSIPDSNIYVLDKDMRFIIAEGEELRRQGIKNTDIEGKDIYEAHPPDLLGQVIPFYEKLVKDNEASVELAYRNNWYIGKGRAVHADNDQTAYVVLLHNITDLKKLQQKNEEINNTLTALLNTLPVPVWILRNDNTFTTVKEITGETATGKMSMHEVINPLYYLDNSDIGRIREIIQRTGSVTGLEIKKENGGVPLNLEISASGVHDSSGALLFTVVAIFDFTEKWMNAETLMRRKEEFRAFSSHLEKLWEEEKAHISRELHDEVGQILTSIKLNLISLGKEIDPSGDNLPAEMIKEELIATAAMIDKSVIGMRKLIKQLRPEILDSLGLTAALEWLLKDSTEKTGIKLNLSMDTDEVNLESDKATAVFRIVQEAVNNVLKHAEASELHFSVSDLGAEYQFIIKDNGAGFDVNSVDFRKSFGILSMSERAEIADARMQLESSPGSGTQITLHLKKNG